MKKAKYIKKEVLVCPYCNFEKPVTYDMPDNVDIIEFNDHYLCGNCGNEFKD